MGGASGEVFVSSLEWSMACGRQDSLSDEPVSLPATVILSGNAERALAWDAGHCESALCG